MALQSRPEPMNASPHHSKVKVTLTLSDPVYVSGGQISGKMQVESLAEADSPLGIGVMMVELFAIQEVISREHSATSTFIHSRRIFQGPGLPPSNAVYSDHVPEAGEVPLPAHHFTARRGQTTFFFQFSVPASSPSSISFGPACVRYEIQATVSVAWRGDKRLVTDKRDVKVVECWEPTDTPSPQAVAVTQGGNIWAQAMLTNGTVVAGEPACINLQLKNHTQRWTSGVTVTLTRALHLSQSFPAGKSLSIFDVTTQVEFRGPEYSVPPGVEGIASLVIDIPRHSRGVKGGLRVDDNGNTTEGFFEVRCALSLRIDLPPGSEDTVIILPVTIYHSFAAPGSSASVQLVASTPYPYAGTNLVHLSTGNQITPYDPTWMATSVSNRLPNGHPEQEIHDIQDVPYPYSPCVQRSVSARPSLQPPYNGPGLSTSYPSSPRFLQPSPSHVSYTGYIHPGTPIKSYTNLGHSTGIVPLTAQNIQPAEYQYSLPPSPQHYPSQSCTQSRPLAASRSRPPPIPIPPLPNPHDSQGIMHSPRPLPSPKHSLHGSVPKNNNVSELERMADEVGRQTGNLSLDLPKGDASAEGQGPQSPKLGRTPDLSMDKTLPAPPVPSSKDIHPFLQRPRVDTLFADESMSDPPTFQPRPAHSSRAPPTPPIAAITPIKFPKAPIELSGLGANLGKESGLDALERKLLAEVGTRKFDAEERPHVRSVVQPIAIPPSGPPPDTVNDSAISSLTLADREGFLNAKPEREQEQDRDSDERTQYMGGGGHSPSEDDRDARTQKGKGSRKLGKSRHSEEDLERPGRRRERKRARDDEGRKLRRQAKGRVAAWLGEIDVSAPPPMDGPTVISPTASHFIPIAESTPFDPASPDMTNDEAKDVRDANDVSTTKVVSASPNPRSSGFVTISTLNTVTSGSGGEASRFKPSPRRSSYNDLRQTPSSSPERSPTAQRPPIPWSPSAQVKRSQTSNAPPQAQPAPVPTQANRLFRGRLPRFPAKPVDPEVKYDVRSARGGRGGKVTQVASLWAAKAATSANAKAGDGAPNKLKLPASATVPAAKKPSMNVLKRSPVSVRSPASTPAAGVIGGSTPGAGARAGDARTGGTREPAKATKATTVPAIVSSSHAVPMLSSTASLARVKTPYGPSQVQVPGHHVRSLPPMISEGVTMSDWRSAPKSGTVGGATKTGGAGVIVGGGGTGGGGPGRALGDLAFGQARLRDLIKKYQG